MKTIKERCQWLKLTFICISYRLYILDLLRTCLDYAHTQEQWDLIDHIGKEMSSISIFHTVDRKDDMLPMITTYQSMVHKLVKILAE